MKLADIPLSPEKYVNKFFDASKTAFRSIRHRNYRLFFIGQVVSLIGTWLQNTALSWLVYTLTKDSRALGLMAFLGAVPVLVLGAYAGTIADEFPKRKILIWTQTFLGVFALLLALCVWQGWTSIWILGAINLLVGVVVAFDLPTRQAFVVEMVGKEDVANAVALNSAIFNAARLIGPAIGAAVIAGISIEVCFFLNGVSFLAVIAGLWMMRIENETETAKRKTDSRINAMKEGIRYLYSIPNYRALMILVVGMTLFAWGYTVNLPVIAVEILHGDSSTYGALLSANGFGALVAALTQAAFGHRIRARHMVYFSIATFCLSMSIIPLVSGLVPVLIMLGIAGWSLISFFITANSTLQRFVPDEYRGRVMGIYSLSFAGLFPFGSLLAGYLSHSYGVAYAMWVDSFIMALIAIPTYLFIRNEPRLADKLKAEPAQG